MAENSSPQIGNAQCANLLTMIYLAPADNAGLDPVYFGVMDNAMQPSTSYRRIEQGYLWMADNGRFTGKFIEETFRMYLENRRGNIETCLGIVAPDVIGDARATYHEFETWGVYIRRLGYPVAYVAQDGQESLEFPPCFDVLFIGGSTGWKMSDAALWCIKWGKAKGKWIHVGRINSLKRVRHFLLSDVDSVDGTHPIYEPDLAIPRIRRWMQHAPLFHI